LLLQHGWEEKNIVLMAYDDIASNSWNFAPGEMFNSFSGPNIYPVLY
jgi:glycosylphosphatidylinositol transamidase (GPIT) subunit GPI8